MIHINNTPITNYKNLEIIEEVNGSLTLSFTSFNYENKAHSLIKEESIVTVNDYDFKIKQLAEFTYSKNIQAISTFFDLGGHYIDDMFAGTRYLDDLLSFTFNGTGWTYSLKTSNKLLTITNYGNDNALKLLLDLCKVAKIEYQIMPNNHVEFNAQIGPDNDAQYRYGHNIKTLSKNVDTTNLRTRIRGYGADGLNVIYTSPNASKFGIIEADPIHDDRFHIEENLASYVKEQLQDEPEIAIELDTVDLINRELGERIWLIYEPLDIEIKSRILSKRSVVRNGELVTESVVIGNSLPKSTSDLFAEQKLEYDTQNKINRSRFEQTNDRITMEVEELEHGIEENRSLLEITAREIRSEVSQVDKRLSDRITTTNSRITQTASEIRSEVNREVKRLDGRVDSANSSITQTAESITAEVNREVRRLDGRVDSANSLISQTATEIRLEVKEEINVVDGKILDVSGNLSDINRDLNSKIDDVDIKTIKNASIINQTAKDIRLEVSQEVEALDGRIEDTNSRITQTSNAIISEVNSNYRTLDGRIESTNSRITQTSSEIRSEIYKLENNVEIGFSSVTQSIKGVEVSVRGLSNEVNEVTGELDTLSTEVSIQAGEISSKVSKGDVISSINQSPERIKIDAENIELRGAVTVLSRISDDLGTITAGNIDIYEDIKVGQAIHLRASRNNTTIYFGDFTDITSNGGDLSVNAYDDLNLYGHSINLGARNVYFTGTVDFSRATVVGLK